MVLKFIQKSYLLIQSKIILVDNMYSFFTYPFLSRESLNALTSIDEFVIVNGITSMVLNVYTSLFIRDSYIVMY